MKATTFIGNTRIETTTEYRVVWIDADGNKLRDPEEGLADANAVAAIVNQHPELFPHFKIQQRDVGDWYEISEVSAPNLSGKR